LQSLVEEHRLCRCSYGNYRFNRSGDGPRWFAAFAALGDWDVEHGGSGAARHGYFYFVK